MELGLDGSARGSSGSGPGPKPPPATAVSPVMAGRTSPGPAGSPVITPATPCGPASSATPSAPAPAASKSNATAAGLPSAASTPTTARPTPGAATTPPSDSPADPELAGRSVDVDRGDAIAPTTQHVGRLRPSTRAPGIPAATTACVVGEVGRAGPDLEGGGSVAKPPRRQVHPRASSRHVQHRAPVVGPVVQAHRRRARSLDAAELRDRRPPPVGRVGGALLRGRGWR